MPKQDGTETGRSFDGQLAGAISDYAASADSSSPSSSVESESADQSRRIACSALSQLLMRDDGWLRLSPDGSGKTVFMKWKFSRGPWSGFYVMAVVETWKWDYGLVVLVDKLEAVDTGRRRPTEDMPFETKRNR